MNQIYNIPDFNIIKVSAKFSVQFSKIKNFAFDIDQNNPNPSLVFDDKNLFISEHI